MRVTVDGKEGDVSVQEIRALIDGALMNNPKLSGKKKEEIIAELRRQARENPLNIHVVDADSEFEFTLRPSQSEGLQNVLDEHYDEKYIHAATTIEDHLRSLSPGGRRIAMRKIRAERHKENLKNRAELNRLKAEQTYLTLVVECFDNVSAWAKEPLVLQKPQDSVFPLLCRALAAGKTIMAPQRRGLGDELIPYATPAEFEEAWSDASVFVIQHDWAAVFRGAADYVGGDLRLPDDVCIFEFQISGRPVIAATFEMDGKLYMQPITRVEGKWIFGARVYYFRDGRWLSEQGSDEPGSDQYSTLVGMVGEQVRAIAIALDAKVAETDVMRDPQGRTIARTDRAPHNSYHIVSLAHRTRAKPLDRADDWTPGTRRRLHFRRGHWRHYETHKSWIKWMLVGDPDLGFVDKEYRL